MDTLNQLYVPQLQQLRAKSVALDETRCLATFDGTVCTGDFVAVKADEGCLITRYHFHMLRDLVLEESHYRSLCIMSCSSNCLSEPPAGGAEAAQGEARGVSVFVQPRTGRSRTLRAGESYETTRITYLPSYFDSIDLPLIGNFDDILRLVPGLDEELLSLRLRGLLEDLDLGAAQKPSGRYYYRSKALQALCHVMDMAYELSRLRSIGVDNEDLQLVRQVMEIVESSLDGLPSIDELSRTLYVGHTHLCETFKSATGMTIGAYARRRRMQTAKVLLRNPSLPIKEIARRMGFKTTGGFTASFKQVEGMTPRQYRRSKLA